jgi:hypothetical protein
VYEVTAEPPFEAGAAKLTVAERLPVAVATTELGAPGAPTVVTEFEGLDAAEVPAELVALTVNVYAVPAVKPVIAIVPLVACEIAPVMPPGDEVAVYEVIVAPPSDAGAVNETFAVVAPVDVAVTDVGASGAEVPPVVVIELEAEEFVGPLPKPPENVTLTINVYAVLGLKPRTLIVPVREAEIAAGLIAAWKLPGEEIAVNEIYVTPYVSQSEGITNETSAVVAPVETAVTDPARVS